MGANEWRHAPTLEAMANATLRYYLEEDPASDRNRLGGGKDSGNAVPAADVRSRRPERCEGCAAVRYPRSHAEAARWRDVRERAAASRPSSSMACCPAVSTSSVNKRTWTCTSRCTSSSRMASTRAVRAVRIPRQLREGSLEAPVAQGGRAPAVAVPERAPDQPPARGRQSHRRSCSASSSGRTGRSTTAPAMT